MKVQCVIRTQGTRGVVVPVETALSTTGGGHEEEVAVMITTAIMMQMRTRCENNAQCSDGR